MKVKDLLKMDVDIDVCDDYDERCYIAFCGPQELKPAGKKQFKNALNADVDMHKYIAWIHAETDTEADDLYDFFYSMAGYCADSDYKKWFVEA